MLNPDDRQTLLDALRPPPGHGLGCAVGTTFSMQLDAVLTAPAAFALYAIADQERCATIEALELLESIRRHAARFTVFFQAGQVAVPQQRRLFAFLEESVVPVAAPLGGVFHPKVWVLRFDAPDAPSTFRVLCGSRNLTYDRSWDGILRLDSLDGADDEVAGFDGTVLADFVARLPTIAIAPLPDERCSEIARLADELRTTRWALPSGMTGGRFHLYGFDASTALPFPGEAGQVAVISPFLSSGLLNRLPATAGRSVIVSRPGELQANGKAVSQRFIESYVLDVDATPAQIETTERPAGLASGDPAIPLEGLHAKVYVFDVGHEAIVLTGSANATQAAFATNVEVMAELRGPVKIFGVDALLAESTKDVQTLRSFLMPFAVEPLDQVAPPAPEEELLERLRSDIAQGGFNAHARSAGERDRYTLDVSRTDPLPELPKGLSWRVWPVTVPQEFSREIEPGRRFEASFAVSFEGITAFFANELRIGAYSTRFVLTARLLEAPENRATRLLGLMIGDASRFLRFLLMLLADDALDRYGLSELFDFAEDSGAEAWRGSPAALPLLEALLRTLARDPERLDHVDRLIRDLHTEPEGRALLPEGLLDIWAPIWSAACELRR